MEKPYPEGALASRRAPYYEPPEDPAGTVFDPNEPTFGPIMAALQAGEFEKAVSLILPLTAPGRKLLAVYFDVTGMTDDEIGMLGMEATVQGESSDEHPESGVVRSEVVPDD